jgi:hypothetical protein
VTTDGSGTNGVFATGSGSSAVLSDMTISANGLIVPIAPLC